MKVAKFIYPMFLVALGLHGLLLFIPTGGDAESASTEEDVELSDLPTDQPSADEPLAGELSGGKPSANKDSLIVPSGSLPVPDLNVSRRTVPAAGKPSIAGSATSSTASRSYAVSRPVIAPSAPAAPPAPRPTPPQSSTQPNAQSAASPASPPASQSASQSAGPNLPDLTASAPAIDDSSASASPPTASNGAAQNPVTNLIATAKGAVSDALKSLQNNLLEELTYSARNTEPADADRNLKAWQSDLSPSGSVEFAGSLDPEGAAGLAQLQYPIEDSKQANRRAFTACLDPVPNSAEVGIAFDGQGDLLGAPALLRSTGYPALNNEILATVADYDAFPANRESKAYTIEFAVDYAEEDCVSLSKLIEKN